MSEQPPKIVVRVPHPSQLREPLILVLGRHTKFTPHVFVESTLLTNDVIREAGYDPDDVPSEWADRTPGVYGGRDRGISHCIHVAFRYGYRDFRPALTIRDAQTGLWGLTEAGAAHALTLAPAPLPRPRSFAEPLLRALGKLSGHTLTSVERHDALAMTLEEAGCDLNNLSSEWTGVTTNGHTRIYETLRWLARSMSTMVASEPRGRWTLTPLGLAQACKLNGVPVPSQPLATTKVGSGPNATARWLNEHLAPPRGQKESPLMRMMRGALTKHLPLSAQYGMVDDHINNFMVRLIHRDAFAAMLQEGGIPYSKVASYCVNSGRSDARNMGTEPVCREMLGARTEKERRVLASGHKEATVDVPTNIPLDTDGNLAQLEAPGTESTLDFEDVWKQIEHIVQENKPGAWERYSNLLLMRFVGFSTQEIAQVEGVSSHRAARMIATVRQMIKGDPDLCA